MNKASYLAGRTSAIEIERSSSGATLLRLNGAWNTENLNSISQAVEACIVRNFDGTTAIDLSGLDSLDPGGALYILKLSTVAYGNSTSSIQKLLNVEPHHQKVLRLVSDRIQKSGSNKASSPTGLLQSVGRISMEVAKDVNLIIGWLGKALLEVIQLISRPAIFRVREFFIQLDSVCVRAIPIVSLVTFLIGIVVAYLLAMQIVKYGANIFIVDGVSIAMCRELSPIIVAIIVAGRSGSAFTAQIGAMKINEEIDALVALGLSPWRVLVVPRLLALVFALPLLVFVGDLVGIFGGVLIAKSHLDITSVTFLDRLQTVLAMKHVVVGLVKAPVFAIFIALIGCRMGFSVENNARSLGLNTTSTVVQSIVAVILLNAAFAVLFAELGI